MWSVSQDNLLNSDLELTGKYMYIIGKYNQRNRIMVLEV